MRSKDKVAVTVERMYKKLWMRIRPLSEDGSLVPSFEDWFRQLIALLYCEQQKYPALPWPHEDAIKAFFCDAIDVAGDLARSYESQPELYDEHYDRVWRELAEKHKLPVRD